MFSCIILFDIKPYRLYISAIGDIGLTFEIEIDKNYCCSSYLEHYHQLINFLEIKYDPKNKFYPNAFFKIIDTNTPIKYNYKKPKYNETLLIAKNHRNIDENNKIYFCGWRRNPTNYNVTKENLEKTKSAFGYKLYDICKKYNISSCWTDNINEEKLIEIDKLIYNC